MNWVRLRPGVLIRRGNRRASSAENIEHKVPTSLKARACRDPGVQGLVCASWLLYPQLYARCQ